MRSTSCGSVPPLVSHSTTQRAPSSYAALAQASPKGTLLGKQFGIDRIGARIAAFDIVDAELIKHARDRQLVRKREIDAVGLRAVAQRGVKEIKPLARHG